MTNGPLADRTMKARSESTCILCHGPIRRGHLIARIWLHARCLNEHRHGPTDVPPGTEPGGRSTKDWRTP